MAKLRGAKKAAFLRRMARGRSKSRRRMRPLTKRLRSASRATIKHTVRRRRRNGLNSYNPSRSRRRVYRMKATRRRRNPTAVIANPGYSKAYAAGWSAAFGKKRKRRKTRKGSSTMAKRRRKRRASARRAAPRRRRTHRRRPTSKRRVARRRRRGGGGGHFAARVRRGTKVIYINGRRRRRGGRSRRRNPSMGGLLKRTFIPYAVGFVTSGAMAVIDTGLANYPMAKNVGKVFLAIGVSAFVGRKHPVAATAAIAAIAASTGYAFGTKLAGGMIAQSPAQAVQGLGEMSSTYPELGALLNGGVGALLNGPPDIDDAVVNYATALNNMADDD